MEAEGQIAKPYLSTTAGSKIFFIFHLLMPETSCSAVIEVGLKTSFDAKDRGTIVPYTVNKG
jgi:hypothetical protein